jgi:hypothetical protein
MMERKELDVIQLRDRVQEITAEGKNAKVWTPDLCIGQCLALTVADESEEAEL